MVKPKADAAPGSKRAKISQAQTYMIAAVLGASAFLGAAIAVVVSSINQISFSASVIVAQDQSIVSFSDTIRNIGICRRPAGSVYTDEELKKCNPDNITAADVPNTLRSNILENLAASSALESVPNSNNSNCINPATKKVYTYQELQSIYASAEEKENNREEALNAASGLIKSCSALRVIPDALPAYENEEALLASVNKIFDVSNADLQSLSPTDETDGAEYGVNLYTISVSLGLESSAGTAITFLNNLERSIRNFNIKTATINWSSNNTVEFKATANAFYMTPSALNVSKRKIAVGGK